MAFIQLCSFQVLHAHRFELQGARKTIKGGIVVRASEFQQKVDLPEQASFLSRRSLAMLGLNLIYHSTLGNSEVKAVPETSGPFSKYMKRKKLDPLDTYIPSVLLSKFQFQDLEAKLLSDKPEYSDCRSLLRSGPVSSLRSNMKAVAQYASEGSDGNSASEAVHECIVSLEGLDSLLLRASRSDSSATIEKMKGKIDAVVAALDKLLTTVPAPILEKCEAIAASYRMSFPLSDTPPDHTDASTKLIESLL